MDDSSRRRKRAHNRTFHTILSGAKMQHLKKKDGEPLWRADIQYDFLHNIFHNQEKVFTSSYTERGGYTFADIYIDSMARSSKCSKILSEKLIGDREAGLSIAMVCMLVNIGRMNTTLNFFPEMKAQLRTYHSIPSLQSNDTAEYKQLQDAPRLKSILKGACEDRDEPVTMEQLAASDKLPPTNPINLIFLMSSYSARVEESFFPQNIKFFDLIMDETLSSASRGRAFLWLMWTYLETNLSREQINKNPFGPDRTQIPPLVKLTPVEVEKENIDPSAERDFGDQMTLQRLAYLEGSSSQPQPVRKTRAAAGPQAKEVAGNQILTVPPPSNFRESQIMYEFRKLVQEKRHRRRRRRLDTGSTLRTTWINIKDLDPLYNSDLEFVAYKKPKPQTPSILAAGLGDKLGDYGEEAATARKVLSVAAGALAKVGSDALTPSNPSYTQFGC